MRNASVEFRNLLKEGKRNYRIYANITLRDGTELSVTNKNLWQGGFSMDDSVSSDNSLDVGTAIVNKFSLTINNIDESFSEYDFAEAIAVVFVSMLKEDGEETEKIRMCTGTVTEPPKEYSSILSLSFYDNMMRFDQPYTKSKLTYPASLGVIVRDACSECGVTLNSVDFPHNDFLVQERPTDEAITFREVISWAAQISGCFCKCDEYGRLEINWYNSELLENPTESSDIHVISKNYQSPTISTDDVVITGVKVVEKNESEESKENLTTYQSGTEGYVISIENNELIKNGAGQTIAGWLGEKLIGFQFRKATMNHASDPTIEAGDVAILIDRKGREYKVIISSTHFSNSGSQNSVSSAKSPALNSATRYSSKTKNYVEWRNKLKKEKAEREKALEELGDRIENSSGVFTTDETDSAGGKIYYLHNKPTLEDSDMVWKMTAEAWAVSTDGGKTWNAGMTVDGDTIVRILTAVGLNADWINAGAITVKDSEGNIIFSVDMDTKSVMISGDSVHIGGKTATQALKDNLQESKDYSDGKLADYADTVSKNLENLQAQVDGQVEDWYFDYEPSMQNYPANEWNTTEEREKHIGDRFFWKSKGYAYRFMEDNGVWGWVLLQDTDITKAMQAAQNAQDTADGKRRTFVETPVPPYDIGDLWTNGTDVLTCTTPSPSGSVFVSSDWEKLNQYTDDTVANQALEEAIKAHNLTVILDNEYQGIASDYNGNIITPFPSVKTHVTAFYGQEDVSVNCTYSVQESSYVTGEWDNTRRDYTVTGLSGDTGWVDITVNYINLFVVVKRFNVAKVKNGKPGENGEPGRTYFIEASSNVLKRSKDNTIAPNFIEFKSFYRDGDSAERTPYSGRFVIEETSDGNVWKTIYTSKENEDTVKHQLYSLLTTDSERIISAENGSMIGIPRDIISVRCRLYASDDTTNLMDMQSVAVVLDVDALTHEEIFDLLTNNGEIKGIYKEGNQLYISFTYAKGGQLKLGGRGNSYGYLNVMDEDNKIIAEIDMNGIGVLGNVQVSYEKDEGIKRWAILTGDSVRFFDENRNNVSRIRNDNYLGLEVAGNYGIDLSLLEVGNKEEQSFIYYRIASDKFIEEISNGKYANHNFYGTEYHTGDSYFPKILIGSMNGNDVAMDNRQFQETKEELIYVDGGFGVSGKFVCWGEKSRASRTKSYSDHLLYSYETPSPLFGDIGEATIEEDGKCYIFFDDIFQETINTRIEYQVFLQKEGRGDLWVDSKESAYFIVCGTPGLKFAWEVKARQKGFEMERLDSFVPEKEIEETINYEKQGQSLFQKYVQEKENEYESLNKLYTPDYRRRG